MRNMITKHMIARKQGPHGKTKKAMRRSEKVKLSKNLES